MLYSLSAYHAKRGYFQQAADMLERSLSIAPDNAVAWIAYGDLKLALNDPIAAANAYRGTRR